MKAPVLTIQVSKTGRPTIDDHQYALWLEDLRPYLQAGYSIRRAIDKAQLSNHRTSLYEKIRVNDWFSDKITGYQALMGDLINESVFTIIQNIHTKIMQDGENYRLTSSDIQIFKLVALHHRSATPFFIQNHKTIKVVDQKARLIPVIQHLDSTNQTEKIDTIDIATKEKL